MNKPKSDFAEQQRLAIINQLKQKSVAAEPRYQRILRLTQTLLQKPIVLISVVDKDTQWFKAKMGTELCETARSDAFCAHAIHQSDIMIVEDATEDERFKTNPLVLAAPYIRFYAGAQIKVREHVLGTLCVIDTKPATLDASAITHLLDLAEMVAQEFEIDLISEQINDIHKIQLLTDCITRVQANFILADDRREAFDSLLQDIIKLTESGYGFIGEVLYDADQAPYLKTFALTNIAWDDATRKFYAENAPSGLEFRNLNTLFGYTLRSETMLIANQPAEHAYAGGIPKGHPPLKSYLGIPIFFDNQMIAMIGLANKVAGYSIKDVDFLKPLTSTVGQLVYAVRIKQQQLAMQRQLSNIVEASRIGTWTLDMQTERLDVNAQWLAMLGYTADELAELTLSWMREHMHPADLLESRQNVKAHIEGQTDFYESQFRIRHKSGHWVWIQARGRSISEQNGTGTVTKLYGINIDITAEKSLQNQLGKLAENVPGMVYQFKLNPDQSVNFPFVGPAVEQLLGCTAQQLLQDGTFVFKNVHPDDVKPLFKSIMHSATTLTQWHFKFRLAANHLNYRWIGGQSTPELQDNGSVIWHGYIQDITEETEMQLALEQAKEQAERAVAIKSSFLANMSHEIRTPMNGVIGMLDILSENNKDANQTESISLMRESAYSLLTIIDDILDFSKLEAGKLNITSEPCLIPPIIENICSMLDYLALKSQVEVTCFIDPVLNMPVLTDPNRLRQILVNLLSNAIKFSSHLDREGAVRISVKLTDQQQQQALLCFKVEDNGIGMAAEVVSKLFQPFTQADDSTSRKYGGTGLGLAITQQLVQLMNGIISVDSAQGIGSTFTITIPVECLATHEIVEDKPLQGIQVVILGDPLQSAFANYAGYLEADGADVSVLSPHLLSAAVLTCANQKIVWLFDAVLTQGNLLHLADMIKQYQGINSRFLVLGRGRRRKPRRTAVDTVYIDANILQQAQLKNAVLAAFYDANLDSVEETKSFTTASIEQHYRLLVLEDNSTNQKVIKQQLQRLGYQVDVVEDGLVGLAQSRQQQYDLILTDLHMPNMDGYQFARAFRKEEQSLGKKPIPLIALTANIVPEELARCQDEGMNDYLVKPLPVSQLKACLEKWLMGSATTEPPTGLTSVSENPMINEAESTLFNTTLLEETVGEESVAEILEDFLDSLVKAILNIEQAHCLQDYQRLAKEAHKLKSSSRFVGAERLADHFTSLEEKAKHNTTLTANTPDLTSDIHELIKLVAEVSAAIKTEINRLK